MAELASTDRLTGLKNRREFDRILGTIPRQSFAILAIDVDHLKRVNDEFGHEAGDTVLRTVATTLALMLRGWDVIARVGGDEFAAILLDVDPAEAASAAQRLRAAMHLVPTPGGRSNISLGWASAPAGTDPMSAWRRADECLYEAKRSGRDRVVGRHVDGAEQVTPSGSSVTELIGELVAGLPIHAVYQPIVDLNDGHVVGYEALARPEGFGASDSVETLFEVAHRSGHIRDLDWLCRRAALSQAASLPAEIPLFMNVSVAALLDPLHDVDQLLLLLEWTGRSPHRLVLEIGEHESVRDLDRLRVVLASYRSAGIRFAIDDLGEGFATTELLETAEPEFVKLARSLTMNACAPELARRDQHRADVCASPRLDRDRRRCRERAGERPDPLVEHPARPGLRPWAAHGRGGPPRRGGRMEGARHVASAPSAQRRSRACASRPGAGRARTPTASSASACPRVSASRRRERHRGAPAGPAIRQRRVGEGVLDERSSVEVPPGAARARRDVQRAGDPADHHQPGERATRERISPTLSTVPEARGDRLREPRSGSGAKS